MPDRLIGTLKVGQHCEISGGWVIVKRHGNMGTEVQPVEKLTRTITSNRTGETKSFSAPQKPYIISSGSPVYQTRRAPSQLPTPKE